MFAGYGYPKTNLFLADLRQAAGRLLKIRPFSQLRERVGIAYLQWEPGEEERLLHRTPGAPPVQVRLGLLRRLSAKLGVYKLVILDFSGSSSIAELSSIRRFSVIIVGRSRYRDADGFAKGFLHELGHALGLRDECLVCRKAQAGFPNCAPDLATARRWWEGLVGKSADVDYVRGCCGDPQYYRPTIASLMNDTDKAVDYGPINEKYLRRRLLDPKSPDKRAPQ